MPNDPPDDLISSSETAAILKAHVRTVHRMVADGRLAPAGKLAGLRGSYVFRRTDVVALAAKAEPTPAA